MNIYYGAEQAAVRNILELGNIIEGTPRSFSTARICA